MDKPIAWFYRSAGNFYLSLIIAMIGGGFITWLVAFNLFLDVSRRIKIEHRTMSETGAAVLPTGDIKIILQDDRCLKGVTGFANGTEIHFYVKNVCRKTLLMPNYSFDIKTPDGTTIESGQYAYNGRSAINSQEKREQKIDIKDDPRIDSVVIAAID